MIGRMVGPLIEIRQTGEAGQWEKAGLLPENCVLLLVGIEPKDTTKPKSRRRRDLLLATSKENTRDLSQSSISPNSKTG